MLIKITKIVILCMLFFPLNNFAGEEGRYISLSPAATEILFAIGSGNSVVGVTTYCNYPEAAKAVLKVGTFSDPNIEKIIALKPDIIFVTGLEQAPSIERLKSAGLNVFVSDPRTFSELEQSIVDMGKLTGKTQEANELVRSMQQRLDLVRAATSSIPKEKRLKVFIEIWYDPIMTAGPGSIVNELITLAGGDNIAYDTPKAYSRFSPEVIIQRNPDVIILGYMTSPDTVDYVSTRFGWKSINAVRNSRVIADINPDLILRPGPRIIDGLELIYRRLYEKNE